MPVMRSSQYVEAAATSAKFTNPMAPGFEYLLTAGTNCWVKVTVTGGAAAADTADNIYVHAGGTLLLKNPDHSGTTNAFVHVIQDSAGGPVTLTRIEP